MEDTKVAPERRTALLEFLLGIGGVALGLGKGF